MAKAAAGFLAGPGRGDPAVLAAGPHAGDGRPAGRPVRPGGGHRRAADRADEPASRGRRSASATARCATRPTGGTCGTRSGRPGVSRTRPSPPGCWRPWPTRPGPPRATRRSASATSCRSGSPGGRPRASSLWHDPRHRQCALASVTSFTYTGDTITGISYAEPAGPGGRRCRGLTPGYRSRAATRCRPPRPAIGHNRARYYCL